MKSIKLPLLIGALLLPQQLTQASIIFSEDFGDLANGTTITTSNTALTYVRVGTQGGSIQALNPSTVGSGASVLITGPTGGSLNGIGVGNTLDFGGSEFISMQFDFAISNTTGNVVWGLGSGDRFTGNQEFSTNQGLVWFQMNGTTLQRRLSGSGGWSNVATGLLTDTAYRFQTDIDTVAGTMDVLLNGVVVASGVNVTTSSIIPDAFRIYVVSGQNVQVDNILLLTPEPSKALLFALGLLALMGRRRRA